MIKVTWFGHSCFRLECEGHSIVIDPYKGVPGYPELQLTAGTALKSHDHGDHAYLKAVKIVEEPGDSPFNIRTIDCWHDDRQGTLRGSNKITIFEAEGVSVAHFGDIGQELDPVILESLKGLDAALIPVGGFYTIDGTAAAKLMDEIDPVVTIPMHYRWGSHGFNEISEVSVFTDAVNDRPVIQSESTSIEIDHGTHDRSVILLRCEGTDS